VVNLPKDSPMVGVDFLGRSSYNSYLEVKDMQMAGIKDLKNRLTHYLRLTKKGDRVIVTDRGVPVAVLHSIDRIEDDAQVEERLASLAKRGMVRLPVRQGKLGRFRSIKVPGKPVSEIIIEERR